MIRYRVTGTSTKVDKLDIPRENTTHIFVRKDPKSHLLTRYRKQAGEMHFPTYQKANDHLIEILTTKANSINEMHKLVKKDLALVKRRRDIELDRLAELNKVLDIDDSGTGNTNPDTDLGKQTPSAELDLNSSGTTANPEVVITTGGPTATDGTSVTSDTVTNVKPINKSAKKPNKSLKKSTK